MTQWAKMASKGKSLRKFPERSKNLKRAGAAELDKGDVVLQQVVPARRNGGTLEQLLRYQCSRARAVGFVWALLFQPSCYANAKDQEEGAQRTARFATHSG